jgi:hypothetical protein
MYQTGFWRDTDMRTTISTAAYVIYVIVHPFGGFWELKHYKKNTVQASFLLLALLCSIMILKLQLTSFMFNFVRPVDANVLLEVLSVIVPLGGWVIINWSISTLADGKGTMKNIWVASIYALFPIVLLYIPQMVISHLVALQEGPFYHVLGTAATLWSFALMLIGNATIHDYTMGKTVLMSFFTVLGILSAIFIGMVFFSTIQQLLSFFISIYFELKYRV